MVCVDKQDLTSNHLWILDIFQTIQLYLTSSWILCFPLPDLGFRHFIYTYKFSYLSFASREDSNYIKTGLPSFSTYEGTVTQCLEADSQYHPHIWFDYSGESLCRSSHTFLEEPNKGELVHLAWRNVPKRPSLGFEFRVLRIDTLPASLFY